MLGEGLWALAHWGETEAMWHVVSRCPAGESLGRDAYGVMLRMARGDPARSAVILRQMSRQLPMGLRAAVLNSALMRLTSLKCAYEDAEELFREMAGEGLWTPVTYELYRRFGAAMRVVGRPPFPGRLDPGQSAHKYTKAVCHALEAQDPEQALARLEEFSREKSWLKFGAEGEKGSVIDGVVRTLPVNAVVVELGTFIGYSACRIARQLGSSSRVLTVEYDAEVACLAENLIYHTRLDARVEVWVGNTEDIVPELRSALGTRPADFVYMDHNQMIYHEDVQRLEAAGIIGRGTAVAATQVLKPGAPLLGWYLAEQERLGHCKLELVSSPDCGCPLMEDWVAVASYHCEIGEEDPAPAPEALARLARLCNLMRWRTAQGLVDEKRWNCFVQHVRTGMEGAGLMSTRHVWSPVQLSKARQFRYIPLDY